jgi:neutral ceramidase
MAQISWCVASKKSPDFTFRQNIVRSAHLTTRYPKKFHQPDNSPGAVLVSVVHGVQFGVRRPALNSDSQPSTIRSRPAAIAKWCEQSVDDISPKRTDFTDCGYPLPAVVCPFAGLWSVRPTPISREWPRFVRALHPGCCVDPRSIIHSLFIGSTIIRGTPPHYDGIQQLTIAVVLLTSIVAVTRDSIADEPLATDARAVVSWKAGVARVAITPEKGVWLAGYGTKRAPDGRLHELWMKALALEDAAGHRAVLITSDFQGVPKSMSDLAFEQMQEKYGLERHQVMFTFSHNHCGPRLGDDLVDYYPVDDDQVRLVEEYTAQMVTRLVDLVGTALSKLAPANLQIGEGHATFAVNRRNNREADVPSMLTKGTPLVGPVDHSVPVMTVTRPNGQIDAILFGYACHPTTLNFMTWCGDYPGFAQLELERAHPGVTAMFVNTCGGDQNPLPRRTVELCERYGQMLAAGVEEALAAPLKPVSAQLRTAFEIVELPYLKTITREELNGFVNDNHAIRARWAARLLKQLDAGETFSASYPYPVHAWRLGREMLVIGQGAESVVDYAIRFKGEFGPGTWVCGYVDDMIAYIPSRRVWEEGGYEGGANLFEYGRPALRWSGEVEDLIAASVRKLVKQVREQ